MTEKNYLYPKEFTKINCWQAVCPLCNKRSIILTYVPVSGMICQCDSCEALVKIESTETSTPVVINPLPQKEVKPIKLKQLIETPIYKLERVSLNSKKDNPYWKYVGKSSCGYMFTSHFDALEVIFLSLYIDFIRSNTWNKQALVGDCTPFFLTSSCPKHPPNAHRGCTVLDMLYFTQYQRKDDNHIMVGDLHLTNFWDGDKFLKEHFDFEKNYMLFKRISEVFPQSMFHMDIELVDSIKDYVKQERPRELKSFRKVFKYVGDPINMRPYFHHHTHVHIVLGSKINYDLEVEWGRDEES